MADWKNLSDAILCHAADPPHMPAIIDGRERLSYAQFAALIRRAVTPTLRENYGCAGGGTIWFLRADEMLRKAGSVGRPAPDVGAEIVDLNDLPMPTGRIGRLRVRAPGMAVGYHNERGEMVGPEGFHDGWYYPGEVASFDEDGYLYIRGRTADLIRRNGTALFPNEIEEVLLFAGN